MTLYRLRQTSPHLSYHKAEEDGHVYFRRRDLRGNVVLFYRSYKSAERALNQAQGSFGNETYEIVAFKMEEVT